MTEQASNMNLLEEFAIFRHMGLRGRNNLSDESIFFVTTSIIRHLPIFREYKFCDILIDNIRHYQQRYKFEVLAYAIMPSHFHWIVSLNPKLGTISDIMRDIKKFTAWQILDQITETKNPSMKKIFKEEASNIKDQDQKLWMKRFHDEVIRNQKMFWLKVLYIHNNPIKAGLVNRPEKYKYSSARNYINNDHSLIEVNTRMGGIYMY